MFQTCAEEHCCRLPVPVLYDSCCWRSHLLTERLLFLLLRLWNCSSSEDEEVESLLWMACLLLQKVEDATTLSPILSVLVYSLISKYYSFPYLHTHCWINSNNAWKKYLITHHVQQHRGDSSKHFKWHPHHTWHLTNTPTEHTRRAWLWICLKGSLW